MDKIEKTLECLSETERRWVKSILIQLKSKDFSNLNIKKLKGRDDIFRVRKGDIRIICRLQESGVFILAIERRSGKTYRK